MSAPESEYEIVTTRHGARAMRDCATGEVMHPVVGPLVESERLYLEPSRLRKRLALPSPEPLVVLDVGLGAGSNALSAWRAWSELGAPKRPLSLISFDRTLRPFELALSSEHAADFGFDTAARDAARNLLARGNQREHGRSWRIELGDLSAALEQEPEGCADVVFWDPFSPRANPDLWTVESFRRLRRLCRPGATVHTYSGSTATRSALLLAGFAVGFGPSIGEKVQTTVAAVSSADLHEPLAARWLSRLERSSAPLPADAPKGALELIRTLPQFDRPVRS
jgi:queuine tRNA-ribosyltransferase